MANNTQNVNAGGGVRVGLRARASNELPAVLADLAQDATDPREATAARWDAVAAANRGTALSRVVILPAVPRIGDSLSVAPYTEQLQVLDVSWNCDPEDDEPAVTLALSDIDLDVLGEEDEAIEWFVEAGWQRDPI